MNKRIVATALWFLAGWTMGSVAQFALSLSTWTALVSAVTLAAIVFADPLGVLWIRGDSARPALAFLRIPDRSLTR